MHSDLRYNNIANAVMLFCENLVVVVGRYPLDLHCHKWEGQGRDSHKNWFQLRGILCTVIVHDVRLGQSFPYVDSCRLSLFHWKSEIHQLDMLECLSIKWIFVIIILGGSISYSKIFYGLVVFLR